MMIANETNSELSCQCFEALSLFLAKESPFGMKGLSPTFRASRERKPYYISGEDLSGDRGSSPGLSQDLLPKAPQASSAPCAWLLI